MHTSQTALDGRARRAAARAGFIARKSRRHVGSLDNLGDFMLIDPSTNVVVAGSRCDMSAAAVIEYCTAAD